MLCTAPWIKSRMMVSVNKRDRSVIGSGMYF